MRTVPYRHTVISRNYSEMVALGHYPGERIVTILGVNHDVDNVREDVWEAGLDIPYVTVNTPMRLRFDDAGDTAAGLGARAVTIDYLDQDFVLKQVIVPTNGASVNLPVTDTCKIISMGVDSTGANRHALGNIYLENVAGTVEYCRITGNGNQSLLAYFCVPAGRILLLDMWRVSTAQSAASDATQHYLRVTTDWAGKLTPGLFHFKAQVNTLGNPASINLDGLPVPGGAEVKISSISSASNSNVEVATTIVGRLEREG